MADRDAIEYLYFKLMYKKAKTLRKTRETKSADETCQYLIDTVKDKLPKLSEPLVGLPAVAAAP